MFSSLPVNGMPDDFNLLRPPGWLRATDLRARCDRLPHAAACAILPVYA